MVSQKRLSLGNQTRRIEQVNLLLPSNPELISPVITSTFLLLFRRHLLKIICCEFRVPRLVEHALGSRVEVFITFGIFVCFVACDISHTLFHIRFRDKFSRTQIKEGRGVWGNLRREREGKRREQRSRGESDDITAHCFRLLVVFLKGDSIRGKVNDGVEF